MKELPLRDVMYDIVIDPEEMRRDYNEYMKMAEAIARARENDILLYIRDQEKREEARAKDVRFFLDNQRKGKHG